uniref:Uncharacterized protein n=1 Tax=Gibberella zeae TaxID=5518 RepID=A0A4E9EFT7_GIBZA
MEHEFVGEKHGERLLAWQIRNYPAPQRLGRGSPARRGVADDGVPGGVDEPCLWLLAAAFLPGKEFNVTLVREF